MWDLKSVVSIQYVNEKMWSWVKKNDTKQGEATPPQKKPQHKWNNLKMKYKGKIKSSEKQPIKTWTPEG